MEIISVDYTQKLDKIQETLNLLVKNSEKNKQIKSENNYVDNLILRSEHDEIVKSLNDKYEKLLNEFETYIVKTDKYLNLNDFIDKLSTFDYENDNENDDDKTKEEKQEIKLSKITDVVHDLIINILDNENIISKSMVKSIIDYINYIMINTQHNSTEIKCLDSIQHGIPQSTTLVNFINNSCNAVELSDLTQNLEKETKEESKIKLLLNFINTKCIINQVDNYDELQQQGFTQINIFRDLQVYNDKLNIIQTNCISSIVVGDILVKFIVYTEEGNIYVGINQLGFNKTKNDKGKRVFIPDQTKYFNIKSNPIKCHFYYKGINLWVEVNLYDNNTRYNITIRYLNFS